MILATEKDFKFPAIQYDGTHGQREYRLLDDYCFEWEESGFRYRRMVFKNKTNTDLASVPDAAAVLGFEQAGASDGAAVIHDNGYFRLGKFQPGEFQIWKEVPVSSDGMILPAGSGVWVNCDEPFTRLRCDKLYRRMCIAGGMSLWRADIEFLALRVGAISPRNGVRWYFS